jgi:hypothetical protein
MQSTARVPSEATSGMTPIDANFRMKKEDVSEGNDGHSSVGLYPNLDLIRVDSCDAWAN